MALLAFGPDRCIVRDALAVLAALLCGEGAKFRQHPFWCHQFNDENVAACQLKPGE